MPSTKEWTSIITSVYFYVMFAVGAVMTAVGVYGLIQWGIQSLAFESYPLQYQESRCEYMLEQPAVVKEPGSAEVPEQTSPEDRYQRCLQSLESERHVRQVTDLSRAIGMIVVGIGLYGIHWMIKKKN